MALAANPFKQLRQEESESTPISDDAQSLGRTLRLHTRCLICCEVSPFHSPSSLPYCKPKRSLVEVR